MIHASVTGAIRALWTTTWHAIVVWCLLAPIAAIVLYFVLAPLLRRLSRRKLVSVPEAA
jgi:predicted PurR-regulated permease PerM